MAGRLIRRAKVTRFSPGASAMLREDALAVEEPLEIRVDGTSISVTMRSPGDDFDLVAGFLVAEGVIWSADQLVSMRYCAGTDDSGMQTFNVVDAALSAETPPVDVSLRRHVLTSSSCGICGTASIEAVHKSAHFGRLDDATGWDHALLGTLPDRLRDGQKVFERTGGVHAAGLFDTSGELLCLREDVGRHNAVDKVVGWALREGRLPLAGTALQVSGRTSFELVQKAHMAGISVLAAVSAPSSLAVEHAESSGMTLIGFSRGGGFNAYAGADRIS
ncbi:formate dehydrogenase accessory sulfurtransferase FdhD [Aeromicrobium sp.]|uniref:formate dehydrogenase accessory sulfurtransferase FdhD n=1 Tax=Aeromicrobium sp. TaxID=1871063 RepID=UPI0030C4C15E